MKKVILSLFLGALVSSTAYARDDVAEFSIADALAQEAAVEKLGDGVAFYFADQEHPAVVKRFVEYGISRKTNAFMKSDEKACQWVFLSAMIALRDKAVAEGGNAVINIKSNYKHNLVESKETFQCGAGAIMAGVALTGTIVTVEKDEL
ncbi:hypothetical protein EDC56_0843 [Sinobacterium caligoides]|uniref:Excinuclease ATPase subunit n=1 Tax=Sinobacterium caligoides TaxID=933926 RepID=A0A3N2DZL4_9GAMM|nr:excinuclease [Sinobacterium caligoides]ROS05313.1 hypothetical protein EDC56_0843 [Sinobacterium caligoides]